MSIEALITGLKESIDRNTEALLKMSGSASSASAPAATEKPAATKGKGKPAAKDEDKVTQEQMNAALVKLKDDFSMDEAKAVITEHGAGAKKMVEVKPAQYKAVYDAAVARHAELSEGGSGDDDDDM